MSECYYLHLSENVNRWNVEKFKVEKGGPAPVARGSYPWHKLEVGDSMVTDDPATYKRMRAAGMYYARSRGWKVRVAWDREKREGRVYRLA